MEPKVNYIVVGAFVLLLGFTVLGAISGWEDGLSRHL